MHPFLNISTRLRTRLFFVFTGWTLLVTAVFRFLDRPLRTAAAPTGIVSFELARTTAVAQSILNSWDATAHLYAGLSLGLDGLYPPLYGTAIGLACAATAVRLQGRLGWTAVGLWLTWGITAAVLFDYIENIALTAQLLGGMADWLPMIAWGTAVIKFSIIVAALLYLILGLFVPATKK